MRTYVGWYDKQSGVSMIEVLIALLVLMIGVLGFSALQMRALAQNSDANNRAMAVLIAQDAVERMQLNKRARNDYLDISSWEGREDDQNGRPPQACLEKNCNSGEMAAWDISHLSWQVANQLPNGRILIEKCKFANQVDCVVVSWDEQEPNECTYDRKGVNVDNNSKCFVVEVMQ